MTEEQENRLREQTDRGARADIVLQELEGMRKMLEEQLFESFRKSDVHDTRGHQAQRFYLQVLDDIFKRFEHYVLTGESARKDLLRIKKPTLVQKVKGYG